MKPDFDRRLCFPIIAGTKEEIKELADKAAAKNADVFSKKVIAGNGYVQPNDEFLALDAVAQAEYAFHEAWHAKPKKDVFGREIPLFGPRLEEGCALAIGYSGAIDFFRGTEHEQDAIAHYEKNIALAKMANEFYKELDKIYAFRVSKDGRPIPTEQVEMERDEVFRRARAELGNELGSPINNAFFVYWDHFLRHFPVIAEGIQGYGFREAVELLSHEREVQRLAYGR